MTMSTIPILDQLKALGSEQTRKIKVNHDLAQQLWSSGIHDARILALLIADPHNTVSKLMKIIVVWCASFYVHPNMEYNYAVKVEQFLRKREAPWVSRMA
jgi:DNA alkylation repair enzyme